MIVGKPLLLVITLTKLLKYGYNIATALLLTSPYNIFSSTLSSNL